MRGSGWNIGSVPANDLEKSFSKILENVGMEVPGKTLMHTIGLANKDVSLSNF